MEPVSVYRVRAAGAVRPSYSFGGGLTAADLPRAVWLGWLPLAFPDFDAPGLAFPGDAWITAPPPAPACGGGSAAPGLVTAEDAAGELAARGACGLAAFTGSPGDVPSDGVSLRSSLALSVADDLEALVGRLRDADDAVAAAGEAVGRESADLDACLAGPAGDSPARRRYGLALRDFCEARRRLHRLLDAVVRIGVFDPGAPPPDGSPSRPAPPGRTDGRGSGS